MKAYKVVTVKTPEAAESERNSLAREGWEVKAVSYWENAAGVRRLVITLERAA